MLVLHGGGGHAEEAKAIGWAGRGYVALAPDLPGIGSPDKLQSLGPFRREKYGAGHYRVLIGVSAHEHHMTRGGDDGERR